MPSELGEGQRFGEVARDECEHVLQIIGLI